MPPSAVRNSQYGLRRRSTDTLPSIIHLTQRATSASEPVNYGREIAAAENESTPSISTLLHSVFVTVVPTTSATSASLPSASESDKSSSKDVTDGQRISPGSHFIVPIGPPTNSVPATSTLPSTTSDAPFNQALKVTSVPGTVVTGLTSASTADTTINEALDPTSVTTGVTEITFSTPLSPVSVFPGVLPPSLSTASVLISNCNGFTNALCSHVPETGLPVPSTNVPPNEPTQTTLLPIGSNSAVDAQPPLSDDPPSATNTPPPAPSPSTPPQSVTTSVTQPAGPAVPPEPILSASFSSDAVPSFITSQPPNVFQVHVSTDGGLTQSTLPTISLSPQVVVVDPSTESGLISTLPIPESATTPQTAETTISPTALISQSVPVSTGAPALSSFPTMINGGTPSSTPTSITSIDKPPLTSNQPSRKVTIIAAVIGVTLAIIFGIVMILLIRRLRRTSKNFSSNLTRFPEKRSSVSSMTSHEGLIQPAPSIDGQPSMPQRSHSAFRRDQRRTWRHSNGSTVSTLGSGFIDAIQAVPQYRSGTG